jgi:hypothetical protein
MLILGLAVVVFVFWAAIFGGFFVASGQSPLDLFLGELEPLPLDVGEWRVVSSSSTEVREERYLHSEADPTLLVLQRRLRDPLSGEIREVLPELRVTRRRRRKTKGTT